MGNTGTDYAVALRQAQANADFFGVPFVISGWGVPTSWYVSRLSTFSSTSTAPYTVVHPTTPRLPLGDGDI